MAASPPGAGRRPRSDVPYGAGDGGFDEPDEIEYVDPRGNVRRLLVQPRPLEPRASRNGSAGRQGQGPLETLIVDEVGTKRSYLYKKLPKDLAESGSADAFEAYDNEVQVGLQLARATTAAGQRYPVELSRLIGYNPAEAAPFMLWEELGDPVERFVERIPTVEAFQVSLLRALSMLETAGVVHRSIWPMTVRWTGKNVQITDFRNARLTGEPCRPAPDWLWSAPEARQPDAIADPAEDLWSAGLVMVHVLNGRLRNGDEIPPELRGIAAGLDQTLDGVFRPEPWDRPSIQLIMEELNASDQFVPPGSYPEAVLNERRFRQGIDEFDRISRAKEPAGSGGARSGGDGAGGSGGGSRSWRE
ncbi:MULTISPECIES: hypothetical protein [unclassified Pseudofrankia]|uniref:hypothetical protein n=1 Tax=unclassified Pseudofrankia TaxID=2994372 RepID=UPI0008DB10CA|nr:MULTISPECIES: hypothetical protein [unclassified Pseudofrankia]MDT3443539.1 hypothetical protein [Pseudofrankia sp. BMG5.37]OHV42738.1 hypothetical protein BCD48_30330 [Pseudofrankia sp. BMG5.36]